jgi:hypothetical protein
MTDWVFVSWTYDTSGISKIYVNGEQKGTNYDFVPTFADLNNGFYATIGANVEGGGVYSPFAGLI